MPIDAAGWNTLSPKSTLGTIIIIMDVGTTTRIVAGPDEGSIGGKARHQQPDPSLFWPPAHPMWRPFHGAQDHVDDSGRGISEQERFLDVISQ